MTTFAGMFQNVTQVREYFMDSWNMRGTVGGANANVSNMFNNAQAVWRLHIGPGMILQGTGLTELVNIGPTMAGYWYKDGTGKADRWGTTAVLANQHYASASCDTTGVHTYTFLWGGEFASNSNAWWRYDRNTHTLSLGLYNYATSANHNVREYGSSLPWLQGNMPNTRPITDVLHLTSNFGERGEDGIVCTGTNGFKPLDFSSWFTGFTNLIDFDGRGLDVSSTYYFDDLFKDDANLQTIDISTWNMVSANRYKTKNNFVTVTRTWPAPTNMLQGTTALKRIVAGNQIYLVGSGLYKELDSAGTEQGLWATGEFSHDNEYLSDDTLWFDTTDHLFLNDTSARYCRNASASGRTLGTLVWTYVPGKGKLFAENAEASWISVSQDTKISDTTTLKAGTLYIGCRPTATNKKLPAIDFVPWYNYAADVIDVRTFGGLEPASVSNWFNGSPYSYYQHFEDGYYYIHSYAPTSNYYVYASGSGGGGLTTNRAAGLWYIQYFGTNSYGHYYDVISATTGQRLTSMGRYFNGGDVAAPGGYVYIYNYYSGDPCGMNYTMIVPVNYPTKVLDRYGGQDPLRWMTINNYTGGSWIFNYKSD